MLGNWGPNNISIPKTFFVKILVVSVLFDPNGCKKKYIDKLPAKSNAGRDARNEGAAGKTSQRSTSTRAPDKVSKKYVQIFIIKRKRIDAML